MQRIANLWKTTGGKIIIIVGSLFALCLLCGVVTAIFSSPSTSAEPTLNVNASEIVATESLLDAPSETPAPTNTSAPTLDSYYSVMLDRIDAYQAAYDEFAVQHQRLTDNPQVLSDSGWKLDMGSALGKLQVAAEDLQTIPDVTARYEKLDQALGLLGSETLTMIENYTTAVDNLDTTYLDQAKTNLLNINEYIRQATDELTILNSNP